MLLVPAAWADPVALRAPIRAPTVTVGFHEVSVGAPLGPVDASVELGSDLGAVGVSVGIRRELLAPERVFGVSVGGSVGVVAPLVAPSVGLSLTGWSSVGWVGERGYLQGLVAAPIAAAVGQGVRLPVWLELQGGVAIGPVLVGPRLGFAAVATPGTDVSVATEGALALSWRRSADLRP